MKNRRLGKRIIAFSLAAIFLFGNTDYSVYAYEGEDVSAVENQMTGDMDITDEDSVESISTESAGMDSETETQADTEMAGEAEPEEQSAMDEGVVSAEYLAAPVSFINDGYPYGKDASRGDIRLRADVTEGSRVQSVQWQYSDTRDGSYQNLAGATSLETKISSPVDGGWYRCVVNNNSISKPVQLLQAGGGAMLKTASMTEMNYYMYWYVSNGTMCYTSMKNRNNNTSNFDIMGLYEKDGTPYWMSTSFSNGWQIYSSSSAVPSAMDAFDSYNFGNAKLDALRFSFDEENVHIIYLEADLAEGERSLAVGADVMLANYKVTSYCDSAALKAVYDDDTDKIKQIQMVGAAKTEEASDMDPALVLKYDTEPDSYWMGYYNTRQAFAYSYKTEEWYNRCYTFADDGHVIESAGVDSGLVSSYTNIPSGGSVKMSFGVGSVAQAGAQISINCGVETNGESTDGTGGKVSVDGTTITATPSNSYADFDGWYAEDGTKITQENKGDYGLDSVDGPTLILNPNTKTLNVIAKFKQNYTVTYNSNGIDSGMPESVKAANGMDDGSDHKGYSKETEYQILSPSSYHNDENKKSFAGWNTMADGSGTSYQPGETIPLESDVTLYAQWSAYPVLSYQANDGTGQAASGVAPDEQVQPAGNTLTIADKNTLERKGYTFAGWSTSATRMAVAEYQPGDEIKITEDTTLYAVWKLDAPDKVDMTDASNIQVTSLMANWKAPDSLDGISGYVIQTASDENFTDKVREDAELADSSLTSATIAGLASGSIVYLRAAAFADDGYQRVYSGGATTADGALYGTVTSAKTLVKVTVSSEQKVQVNLAVGSTAVDYSNFESDLKDLLVKGGLSESNIMISAASSSAATSTSSFSWNKYDHTNASSSGQIINIGSQTENPCNAQNRHIVPDSTGSTMRFYGYGSSAYKDFYLYANSQTTRKEIEFNVTEGIAYDAFDGAGFLVNASVTGSYSRSESNKQKLNGYLIFAQYNGSGKGSGIKVFQLTNVNTYALQQGMLNSFTFDSIKTLNSPQTINSSSGTNLGTITLVANANTSYGDYKYRKLHIKVLPTYIQVWYSGGGSSSAQSVNLTENNANRDNYLVKWSTANSSNITQVPITAAFDEGSFRGGFGPLASYRPHGCEQETQFTMSDISLDMDVVKSLTETIRNPEWKSDYDSYLINLNEAKVEDFSNEYSTSEIINRLIEDDVTYIGWCGSLSVTGSQEFLDKMGKGKLVNVNASETNTYDKQVKAIADYILSNVSYLEGKQSTVTNEEDLCRYIFTEKDNWQIGGVDGTNLSDGGWTITKSENGFDTLGSDGNVEADADRTILAKDTDLSESVIKAGGIGYYQVYRSNECYDKDGNFDSNAPVYLQIRINQEPDAGFTVTTSGQTATITSQASDDRPGYTDTITVKRLSDNADVSLTDGKFNYDYNTVYMIRQTVTDVDGASATYTQQFAVNQDTCSLPYGSFTIDKTNLMTNRDTRLRLTDGSSASDGSNVTATYQIKDAAGNYYKLQDNELISNGKSSTSFTLSAGESRLMDVTALGEGTYTITMTAMASSSGKKNSSSTSAVTRSFTVGKGSKIVYALNGGTVGGKDSLAYHYEPVGTMVTLPVAEPQKDGLAFAGWQISDGTSTYYMAGESFKVPDTAQLTVTAVFKDTMTLTIDNSFVYYKEDTDGSHRHDASAEKNYPATQNLKLQWRKTGETAWTDYSGALKEYHSSFALVSGNQTFCDETRDCTGKKATATGSLVIKGLEVTAADNKTAYEYRVVPEEISQYQTTVADTVIKAAKEATVQITTRFNPEEVVVPAKFDTASIPSWYVGAENPSANTTVQYYAAADKTWKVFSNATSGVTLNEENQCQSQVTLWKYAGQDQKGLSYRLQTNSLVMGGKEYVDEAGKIKLPNILAYSYQNMTIGDNNTKELIIKIGFNKTLVDYDEDSNTLKLKKDIKLDEPLIIDGDVTIDLNGHTLTGADGENTIELPDADDKLTVVDTSEGPKKGQIRGGQGISGAETGGAGGSGIYAPKSSEDNVKVEEGIKVSGGKGGTGADGTTGASGKGQVTVDSAKKEAEEEIENSAENAKKNIDEMDYLSEKEKEEAKKKIDEEKEKAKDAIKNASDLDDINNKKDSGLGNLDKEQGKAEESNNNVLDVEKDKAKEVIENTIEKAKENIDALENLSQEEKEEEKAKLDQEKDKAFASIDAGKNVDEVTNEQDRAEDRIAEQEKSSDERDAQKLSDAKDNAKDELEKAVEEAKGNIDALENLTPEEKEAEKAKLDEEKEKVLGSIENAKNLDELGTEKGKASDTIAEQEKSSEEKDAQNLADAKDGAKADLEKDAQNAKDAIDKLPDLTDEEKQAAKDETDKKLEEAKDAIDNASNVAEISDVKDEQKDAINTPKNDAAQKQEDRLNEAKEEQKKALEEKAQAEKDAIDKMPELSDEEKETAKAAIDKALEDAKQKIDEAASISGVSEVKTETEGTMDSAKAGVEATNNQRAEEKAEKERKAQEVANNASGTTGKTKPSKKSEEKDNADTRIADSSASESVKDAATEIAKVVDNISASMDENAVTDDTVISVGENPVSYKELVEAAKEIEVKPGSILEEMNVTPEEMAALLCNPDVVEACLTQTASAGLLSATLENKNDMLVSGTFVDTNHVVETVADPKDLLTVLAGNTLEIRLVIESQDELEHEDVLVDAMDEDMDVATRMQVNLFKIWNDADWENIRELTNSISFTLDVAEELQKAGRKFTLYLAHENSDGELITLRCDDTDDDDTIITCSTDRFCDGLLAYVDTQENETVTETVAKDKTSGKDFILFNFLALLGLLAAAITEWVRKRKQKIVTSIITVAGVVLFVLDFGMESIRWFDMMSIVFAILWIVVLAGAILLRKKENR